MNRISLKTLTQVVPVWGIDLRRPRPDIPICGSPERCVDRLVIEDAAGELFIVEKRAPESISHKQRIAEIMNRLRQSGLLNQGNHAPLFDFVLAQRFAWFSEWLHKSDQKMTDLECVYIQLLFDNKSTLQCAWRI